MRLPFLFRSARGERAETAAKTAAVSANSDSWWHLFTNALYMAVDDSEDLLRARDRDYARKLAHGAGNIADAAMEEFNERFGGCQ